MAVFTTLAAAATDNGPDPLSHVTDKVLLKIGGVPVLTMNMVTMTLLAGLLIWTMTIAAKAISTGPEAQGNERYITKGRFAQLIEVVVLYLRDTIIRPQLGDAANRFTPYLLTLFFFILFNNVFGLVPLLDLQHLVFWGLSKVSSFDAHAPTWVGGTATGNIAVTAALAVIAFIIIQINGLRSSGLKGWAAHFLGGAPAYLAPIMIPVEIMGMIIKPFALAIRLFANMTAGHTLVATLLMFTGMGLKAVGLLGGAPITLVSVIALIPLMFLELFVAFLQAFIFMFLTTVFIAQLMHHHHDEHAGAEDYDQAHPAENDLAVPVSQY